MKGSGSDTTAGTGSGTGTATPTAAPAPAGFDLMAFLGRLFGGGGSTPKTGSQGGGELNLNLGGMWDILSAGLVRLVDGGVNLLDDALLGDQEKYEIDQGNQLERDRINAQLQAAQLAAQSQQNIVLGVVFVIVAGGIVYTIARRGDK